MTTRPIRLVAILLLFVGMAAPAVAEDNLVADPSFEEPIPKDRWGHVFAHWSGWQY